MSRRWRCGDEEAQVILNVTEGHSIEVQVGDVTLSGACVSRGEGLFDVSIDGRVIRMHAVSDRHGGFWVHDGVQARHVQPSEGKSRSGGPMKGSGRVTAPMPGKVVQVAVKVGDRVEAGQVVAVLEAMKMEQALKSDVAGAVAQVLVEPDTQVDMSALIVQITPDPSEGESG